MAEQTVDQIIAQVDAHEQKGNGSPPILAHARKRYGDQLTIAEREAERNARKLLWQQAQVTATARTRAAVLLTDAQLADLCQQEAQAAMQQAAAIRVEAGYGELVSAVAKLVDRSRLLREKATSITASAGSMTVEEKRQAILAHVLSVIGTDVVDAIPVGNDPPEE